MAVTNVELLFSGLSGKDDATGLREYVQKWLVETDTATDGANIVKSNPSVPQYGTFYRTTTEQDPFAFLASRDALPASSESSTTWHVICQFSTRASGSKKEDDPLNTRPEIEWDFLEYREVCYFAWGDKGDGNTQRIAVVNSAGDFYNPPFERDGARLVLRVGKPQGDYNPLLMAQYANALNSDYWYGFPPLTVMFKPPRARFVTEKGIDFWRVGYEFQFNFDGWTERVWDAGLREYTEKASAQEDEEPGYKHITNDDGTFVSQPVLLDGEGRRLIPIEGEMRMNEVEPFINTFRFYKKLPFGPLRII